MGKILLWLYFGVFWLQHLEWPLGNNSSTDILPVWYSVPWIFPWFLPSFCLPLRCRGGRRQFFECLDFFPWRFITPLCLRCNTRARSTRRHVCHLFMLRTTVCSCAAPTWERFPARGSVTWLFLFQVKFKWSWLHLTRWLSHVYVFSYFLQRNGFCLNRRARLVPCVRPNEATEFMGRDVCVCDGWYTLGRPLLPFTRLAFNLKHSELKKKQK